MSRKFTFRQLWPGSRPSTGAPQEDAWSSEELFFEGDDFYSSLLEGIENATNSIDLEVYIFENDAIGQQVVAALCRARTRGVKVRIIADGVGSRSFGPAFGLQLRMAGVAFKLFHPLPWGAVYYYKAPVLVTSWLGRLRTLNQRNHRKVCVIDSRFAWVGSFNIIACHSRVQSGDGAWRDTGAKVEGGPIHILQIGFEQAWRQNWRRLFRRIWRREQLPPTSELVRLNVTSRHRNQNYRGIVRKIRHARKRVWIANAYFVPEGALLRALRSAAARGVDVRVLLPQKSDVVFIPWVASALRSGLLRYGVKIFEYQPRILHAKTILVDGWCSIGSSNLNHRSLFHDLEADVTMLQPRSLFRLGREYLRDLQSSQEIHVSRHVLRPWWQRLLGRIALLAKFWL